MELALIFSILNVVFTVVCTVMIYRRQQSVFHPLISFSLGHMLAYGFSLFIYYYLNSKVVFGYYTAYFHLFSKITLLGFVYYCCVVFSYYVFEGLRGSGTSSPSVYYKVKSLKTVRKWGVLFLLLGLLCLAVFIKLNGGLMLLQGGYGGRMEAIKGKGILRLLFYQGLVWGSGLLAYYYSINKNKLIIFSYCFAMFCLGILIYLALGARTMAFFPFIISIAIALYMKRFQIRKVAVIGVSMLLFAFILEPIRSGDGLKDLGKLASISWTWILLGLKGSFIHFAGLFSILENVPNHLDYQLLYTFKDTIIFWIPRALYPSKPLMFGTSGLITDKLLHDDTFTSVTSSIGEWYVQLGYLGIVVGGLLVGLTFFAFYRVIVRSRQTNNPAQIVLAIILVWTGVGMATRAGLETTLMSMPGLLVFYFIVRSLISTRCVIKEKVVEKNPEVING